MGTKPKTLTRREQLDAMRAQLAQDRRELAGLKHELPNAERRVVTMRARIEQLEETTMDDASRVDAFAVTVESTETRDAVKAKIAALQKQLARM